MTKFYFGCDEIPRSWGRYTARCNAVELDLSKLEVPPKLSTLNKWRVDTPKGFAFVLHADPRLSTALLTSAKKEQTELSQDFVASWQTTLEQARALAAKAILISTPPEFSPNQHSRALMEAFGTSHAREASMPVMWESQGMWDSILTRDWAHERSLVYAYDPFLAVREEEPFLHGDAVFTITERAGMRREFDRYDISQLLDELGSYNRVFFLLRGRYKWKHAEIFHDLLG